MNKYLGFFELKSTNLPSVPWKRFTEETRLDKDLLWTIRVAVEESNDLNLPRLVGVTADEAIVMGRGLLEKYSKRGIVIYYPYFIAEKSGVLEVNSRNMVIEAVDKDLWNLVTYGRRDVTIVISYDEKTDNFNSFGKADFLKEEEVSELKKQGARLKGKFRDELSEGKSVFAEWSYAYNTDLEKKPIGPRYLIFYELRTVK
jgi:hypothetical protein